MSTMDFTGLKNFIDMMAEKKSPGCSVNVFLKGKEVFSYSAGYSDIESGTAYSGKEYINIYSCSKIATVTAGAQLVERGAILLSDPLYEYIPEYKTMYIKDRDGNVREATQPIRVGDLFSMTTGFHYNIGAPSIKKAGELTGGRYDTLEVVRAFAQEPLSFEPGSRWQYSFSHDVLGGLIEVVSGMRFRDYMKKNIFDPLGMDKSVYHSTPEIKEQMATQYTFEPFSALDMSDLAEVQRIGCTSEGRYVKCGKDVSYVLGPEFDSGGAGITTTPDDYVKLIAALAGGGLGLTGERILSSNTVDLLKTNRLGEAQLKDLHTWIALLGYGYGLGVRTHMDRGSSGSNAPVGEFGWGGAAGATAIADTDNRLAVFFAQHCLNPREPWYQPRLRNVVYGCL